MTSRREPGSSRQPMSQKFVHATCLISGSASPVSRTNGSLPYAASNASAICSGRRARGHAHVDRLENAAIERHEMRHERDRRAELLFHLGDVPMAEDAVGGDRSVVLGEMRAIARRAARAGDAGLRVDDDAGGGVEQPGFASGSSASSAAVG